MTDKEIIAAIRAQHLTWNIDTYEARPDLFSIRWREAFVDGLGGAPYLHVPIHTKRTTSGWGARGYCCTVRVYAPARLGRRFCNAHGGKIRWGSRWLKSPPRHWSGPIKRSVGVPRG